MKQLKPDLANTIVKKVGWSSIKDTQSVVTKKDVEIALQYFDKEVLRQIEETYTKTMLKSVYEKV